MVCPEAMQPEEVDWEGFLSHSFRGLHEGCGYRSGQEKQVLHRLLHPLLPFQTCPSAFKLPAPHLSQEDTRPASWRVPAPSKLQRSAKWVSPTPSRPNSIEKSIFR